MVASLQMLAKKGWKDYPVTNRVEWVKRQPAQLTLVVSNIFWCASVETALKDTDVSNELGYLHESLVDQLQALCKEVRLNIPGLTRKVASIMLWLRFLCSLSHAGTSTLIRGLSLIHSRRSHGC